MYGYNTCGIQVRSIYTVVVSLKHRMQPPTSPGLKAIGKVLLEDRKLDKM